MSIPVRVDFLAVSYYGGGSSVPIRITKDLERPIEDRHVLIIEDIVDTGMTLNYLMNFLSARKPASLNVCTLLDKRVRRLVNVPLKYVGFEIEDEFVVGYGLDYNGQYRNLEFIATLKPEVKEQPVPASSASALPSPVDATALQA
jgi:hypoxanthine phosphoribosyltransferase